MRGFSSFLMIATIVTGLSACGKPAEEKPMEPAPETVPPVTEAAPVVTGGEATFVACTACHTIAKGGPNGIGPNLWGIVGRPVASVKDFEYSEAMKAKGGVWDVAALDTYLAAPMKIVPGTKMAFTGVPDAAKRKELIDWLATKKD